MSDDLFVGMTVYHRTNKIKAEIIRLDEENITVKLCSKIQEKSILKLPITHIGEWLFFNEGDIELPAETLAKNTRYLKYKNQKIVKAYNEYLERQMEIEDEKERKLIALERQKQREIEQKQQREQAQENKYRLNMELIEFLKLNFSFNGFYHYTDFTNFIKIMKMDKLLSRNEAEKLGFIDAAEQSVIQQTSKTVKDSVRFFYKEKTPTIYSNEGIKIDDASPHMPIPVILLFSEDIINHSGVAFTSGCGGSKYSQITNDIQIARNYDWVTIFSREPIPTDENSIITIGYDLNKANIINKRNAEFLYYKEIDIKYVKKIIFRCPADLKHAVVLLGTNKLFEVDQSKYNNHRNYLYNYDFEYKQNYFKLALMFRFENYNCYSHKLFITYEDGFSELIDIANPNNRIVEMIKPKEYEYFNYYFDCLTDKNRVVVKMEYMMNDYICAIWEVNKNDTIL